MRQSSKTKDNMILTISHYDITTDCLIICLLSGLLSKMRMKPDEP